MNQPPIGAGAVFSLDRQYRFALWRRWDLNLPMAMFIGLNPSKANEQKSDPTINRVLGFAEDAGFGGFYMTNLFAFVTPYPDRLPQGEADQIENDQYLEKVRQNCEKVIFAWGAFGHPKKRKFIRDRADAIMLRFPGAYCLGKTAGGYPRHPLFLPGETQLIPF